VRERARAGRSRKADADLVSFQRLRGEDVSLARARSRRDPTLTRKIQAGKLGFPNDATEDNLCKGVRERGTSADRTDKSELSAEADLLIAQRDGK